MKAQGEKEPRLDDPIKAYLGRLNLFFKKIKKGDPRRYYVASAISRDFFEEGAPKGFEEEQERIKFNRRLDKLPGNRVDEFWIRAYRAYLLSLDEYQKEMKGVLKKYINDEKDKYRVYKEEFDKSIKKLTNLSRKGFIKSLIPDLPIEEDPEDLSKVLGRHKPITLFIWFFTRSLKKLKISNIYKTLQDFLSSYLGEDLSLSAIKKASQRNPFNKGSRRQT